MDDRKQRIVVEANDGEGVSAFGWEVKDAGALDALAGRLEAAGVNVTRGSRALAGERLVEDLVIAHDPVGNRLEIFHGPQTSAESFKPGRAMSGFRTGPLGLGHVVLNVERVETIDQLLPFYRDLLGFRLTDYYHQPFEARFLHVNPRHHSLAFVKTGNSGVHHIMMEVFSFDDMGQAYDIALNEGRVATTLGRHTSDFITSFYSRTPSGFMVEYGWGARSIDPDTWQAYERKEGPSLWGHDRTWLSPEDQASARALRLQNAASGMRAPVQVMEGNYSLMAGVCPWWDRVRGGAA
jgi:2,3-dihydroxybiphenyl 1,2-dioxygenase